MKPCDCWQDELADHVAGAPASAALTAHLEECPACAAAGQAWRARMQEIDASVRQWGAAEASAGAIPRILAEVREQSARRFWFPEWKMVAAGVFALVILALSASYVRRDAERRGEVERILYAAATIANWKSPTHSLLPPAEGTWPKGSPRLGEAYFEWKTDPARNKKEMENR